MQRTGSLLLLILTGLALSGCSDDDSQLNNNPPGADARVWDGAVPPDGALPRDGAAQPDGAVEEGPQALYAGAMASAVVPGWSDSAPRPLVVLAQQSASTDWVVSMARIHADGSVSDIIADQLRVWGWSASDPCAPELLYSGAMASADIPGWNAAAPWPLIVLAQQSASTDWVVSMGTIQSDGTVTNIIADQVRVWGWTGGVCPPDELYNGAMSTAAVPGWSASAPGPLIVLSAQEPVSIWNVSMARIHANGALDDILVDRVRIWGW
jgi:hypothetical protein